MSTRRDFLKHASLVALAPTVPGFLARTARAAAPERDRRVLVVIQMDGGNDGLNTVVPFKDPEYAKLRPRLRLPAKELHKVNDAVGLHPALRDFAKLLEKGQLAVVPGVGYPNPNRSHFRSMAIWHSARLDPEEHGGLGWVGRALDGAPPPAGSPAALLVGPDAPPVALRGRRSAAAALDRAEDFALSAGVAPGAAAGAAEGGDDLAAFVRRNTLDAYATAARLADAAGGKDGEPYPSGRLAERLKLVARLIKAGLGTRVYYAVQPGYDTHATQAVPHYNLLNELAGAVRAFLGDLAAAKLDDRVAVLAFSEFGRQIKENASSGTDHGTAGPVFLAGPAVRAGLAGTMPSLTDLEGGEPKSTADFRRVYAAALEDWLGLPTRAALGGEFAKLPLFRG
jgi:uncharacterized protein (DUF1501 family)